MAISIDWYDKEKTIIQVTFEGIWTINEFLDTVKKANEFSANAHLPAEQISMIANLEKSAGIPRGVSVLPHFRYALTKLVYQYLVVAGGTSFGIALTRVVSNALPEKMRKIFLEDNASLAAQRIESLRTTITN